MRFGGRKGWHRFIYWKRGVCKRGEFPVVVVFFLFFVNFFHFFYFCLNCLFLFDIISVLLEEWVGISLQSPRGKNNGTLNGKKYFETKTNHGCFVKLGAV